MDYTKIYKDETNNCNVIIKCKVGGDTYWNKSRFGESLKPDNIDQSITEGVDRVILIPYGVSMFHTDTINFLWFEDGQLFIITGNSEIDKLSPPPGLTMDEIKTLIRLTHH